MVIRYFVAQTAGPREAPDYRYNHKKAGLNTTIKENEKLVSHEVAIKKKWKAKRDGKKYQRERQE